jgi:hypothetical protein
MRRLSNHVTANAEGRTTTTVWMVLALLLAFLALDLCGRAARKPFWFDEILTIRIAAQPAGAPMWQAMTAGFEFTPPAAYLVTRLVRQYLGTSELTVRLPEIVCGIVVWFCTFVIVNRRFGAAAGFGAVFLILASGASAFFIEARAYALVLAGVMLAWMSWQSREWRPGALSVAGIASGLALALAAHMWAIVAPACFLLSAAVRGWMRGKLDWPAVAAVIGPCAVAACYPALVAGSRSVLFAGPVYEWGLGEAYGFVLGFMPHLVIGCLVVFLGCTSLRRDADSAAPSRSLPADEAALALSLIAAPAAIFAVTSAMHSAFMTRYALVAAPALAVLLAQGFAFFESRHRLACHYLLLAMGGLVAADTVGVAVKGWHLAAPAADLRTVSRAAMPGERIVYTAGLRFLEADYYAPPEIAGRLAFVADRDLARQLVGTDGVDAAYVLGKRYFGLRGQVLSLDELASGTSSFLLVGAGDDPLDWLTGKLQSLGAELRAVNGAPPHVLRVTLPAAQSVSRLR